jgi:uncharacterized HAD superfamily protein
VYKFNEEFDKFQLEEYKNISQAHFKTNETISIFFRYYLLIMSIPILVAGFFVQTGNIIIYFEEYYQIFAILLFIIGIIGCCMLGWTIVLRMDCVLYARTINGVRKYFYDRINKDFERIIKSNILPHATTKPHYFELFFFGPVIFCFSIINTTYFSFGYTILRFNGVIEEISEKFFTREPILFFFIFILLQILLYRSFSNNREFSYLKSSIIGVDIDGVLNKHREKFCEILKKNTGKDLSPEDITKIPVHENPKLSISREDEKKVFNDPEYWINLPKIDDAIETLNKIKNIFHLKVFIFTYRDWPQLKKGENYIKNEWKENTRSYCNRLGLNNLIQRIEILDFSIFKKNIDKITRLWLFENGIKFPRSFKKHNNYIKLIIEKGSEEVTEPRRMFKNRFYESSKNNIKFFVEDDLRKAIKLSYICDFIFLLDHPYNQEKSLPNNVFRVKSWGEIYTKIRELI